MFVIAFDKRRSTALLGSIQFQLHLFDVQQLLFQLGAALGDLLQHGVQLLLVAAARVRVVELDQFAAFGEGKTDALAAQDQLQADLSRGE